MGTNSLETVTGNKRWWTHVHRHNRHAFDMRSSHKMSPNLKIIIQSAVHTSCSFAHTLFTRSLYIFMAVSVPHTCFLLSSWVTFYNTSYQSHYVAYTFVYTVTAEGAGCYCLSNRCMGTWHRAAHWNLCEDLFIRWCHRGLQLVIIFIKDKCASYFNDYFFHEMSKKCEKCSSQFPWAQCGFFRLLLLSKKQPKTQRL